MKSEHVANAIVYCAASLHDICVSLRKELRSIYKVMVVSMGNKALYDLLRRPYWWVFITHDGVTIYQNCYLMSKYTRFIDIPRLQLAVILPDISSIPPIRWRSGTIIMWEDRDAVPLELVDEKLAQKIASDADTFVNRALGICERRAVPPKYWAKVALDGKWLHQWFEADVAGDILSDEKKEMPWWLAPLIVAGIVGIVAIFAIWWMSKTGDTTIIQQVSPLPTVAPDNPGYVVVK